MFWRNGFTLRGASGGAALAWKRFDPRSTGDGEDLELAEMPQQVLRPAHAPEMKDARASANSGCP
jgi:hypothetical protein